MRTWIETTAQPEYHRLCGSILALARAASGRLLSRDGDAAASQPMRPKPNESRFGERSAELRAAWLAAEQVVPGGGPLGRLGRLLRTSNGFVEPLLLSLAAAPMLDRSVARSYARLDREAMTAGLLLDLASATEASRMALFGALHPDAPLRRNGLLLAGRPDDAASAGTSTPLAVAPSVLSVLRCEPVPVPRGVDELSPVPLAGAATRVLEALGVPLVRPGDVVSIAGGAAHTEALARLLAGAESSVVWRLRVEDHAEPDWQAMLRDAALGNAICLVTADAGGAWLRRLRWVVDRSLQPVLCALPADQVPPDLAPAVDIAALRARADLGRVHGLADEPIARDLAARLLQPR